MEVDKRLPVEGKNDTFYEVKEEMDVKAVPPLTVEYKTDSSRKPLLQINQGEYTIFLRQDVQNKVTKKNGVSFYLLDKPSKELHEQSLLHRDSVDVVKEWYEHNIEEYPTTLKDQNKISKLYEKVQKKDTEARKLLLQGKAALPRELLQRAKQANSSAVDLFFQHIEKQRIQPIEKKVKEFLDKRAKRYHNGTLEEEKDEEERQDHHYDPETGEEVFC